MEGKPDRFIFTREIIDRAKQLREQKGNGRDGKKTWQEVAQIIECPSPKSLKVTVSLDNTGKRMGRIDELEKTNKEIKDRVIKARGKITLRELATEYGVTRAAISQRLTRLGLDKEVRAEMSKDLPEV